MSEDRELKVMESRVRAAMEKCPTGKDILRELFYPEPKEKWEEFIPTHEKTCYLYPYISFDGWILWECRPEGWIKSDNGFIPFDFKFENCKYWKTARKQRNINNDGIVG